MKTKKILLLFIAYLFGCGCLFAQQQELFYYYKGKPISLNVNSQHFLVYADAGKISMEELNREFKITESIETGQNGILEVQVNLPNVNYDSVINVLKTKEYIIDIEPVIGNMVLYNTSRLFYVKLHTPQDYSLLSSIASRTGAEIRGEVSFCENWYELSVDKNSTGNSIETANQFWESQYFADIDPGFIFHFEPMSNTSCVSDSRFDEQWGMQVIKACSAWKITVGDTNTRIGVIDRGIDVNHKEFDSINISFSYDAETDSSPANVYGTNDKLFIGPPETYFYHGTLVGGIIFANHNRYSMAGVAPKSSLINISTCFKSDDSMAIKLANSFYQAIMNNARVINNSWGDNMGGDMINTYMHSVLLETAIDDAIDNQTVVVFSVGNNDCNLVSYPACYTEEILAVGSVSEHEYASSCFGLALDIMAPGEKILSTQNNNEYCKKSGTSVAAPHVSGVAGLMFSINPNLTGQDVRDIIEQTARKVHPNSYNYSDTNGRPNGSWCETMGYGLLDAHRAVLKAAYHKVYGDTALTFCDTSRHPYTVRAPHNANIDSVSFFWTCSDNLQMVAGQNRDSVWVKFTNSGIGQLQCHIIHDGDTVISTLDISNMSGRTMYDNLTLNSSLSYPDTFVLSREVVVDSLTMLTWQDKTVLCTPDCRLIVRPRGLLTLNHTTLTSACPNELWQGIEVVGDRTKRQIPQWQGTVELKNGAVIENARCGIRTGLGEDNWHTTGGIIKADSSFFINNRRAVEFLSYTNHSPAGTIMDNQSSFSRCVFTVDNNNLFSQNNTAFLDHVTMWEVRGVKFLGCTFSNQTSERHQRRHAIYANDAGFKIDTYCKSPTNIFPDCKCPEALSTYNTFSGFSTAVEVLTTGVQHAVQINHALFSNNHTAVKIDGNHYASVTRCEFDLDQVPIQSLSNRGLDLRTCTGYLVEGNTFSRSIYSNPTLFASTGIYVDNSGNSDNLLHRNTFEKLGYGIRVNGANGDSRTGLQATCNDFIHNKYDIYMSNGSSMKKNQGESSKGADNSFSNTQTSSFRYVGSPSITYYYSSGGYHTPYNLNNSYVNENSSAAANPCSSTLCNDGWVQPRLADFQSDMDTYTGSTQPLSDIYYTAVRTIMSDTVLDLNELEIWHTVAQPISDPYSLTETRFMEGYAEIFAENAEDAEMTNYADFHALKLALRGVNDGIVGANNYSPLQTDGHINWYALTPAQIAQLQTIAERNTGRASEMAKGVLCFFHGICYEDERDNAGAFDTPQSGDDTTGTRAKHIATDNPDEAALSVYPNPTDDVLFIELRGGAEIANVTLYDLQGRKINSPNSFTSPILDMKSVPAGVYILRVTDTDGKEYHRKIVRK